MFSGIVDAIGSIADVKPSAGGQALSIRSEGYWRDLMNGASVAVDGVCLTLTTCVGDVATFDVIAETLRRTTLCERQFGEGVNLQKSLQVGDRIDGHFVQGHVDAIGVIARVEESPAESKWWIKVDLEARPYIVPKGSVTIDGISLTIADVANDLFSVALIPTTLERTTIGQKRTGSRVNIETDILARTVVQHLRRMTGGSSPGAEWSVDWLRRHGLA